jgi:DNA-binding transcriptional LysR family regulator
MQLGRLIGLPPGQAPVLAVECDDLSLLRTLCKATDTVIGASDASCRAELESGELIRLDVRDLPPVYSEMGIALLANRTPSPMASRAIGCVQSVAKEMNVA